MRNRLKYIYSGIVLAFLMVLTLMPVEQRWAQTDVVLIAAMPVMAITGGAIRLFCRQGIRLSVVDMAVAIWMAYYVGRTWIGAEYPCRTEFLKTAIMFMLYITLRMIPNTEVRILPYLIMAGGMVEALWGGWQLLSGSSRHGLFLITGSCNNPGPYSAYLVMAALTALVLPRNIFTLTTASLCLAILPATWSRAAFVSLAVCMLWIYRRKYWRYRYALWGILAITAVTFYYIKQGSADGRMVIWQAALTAWQAAPWFGVGTGGFCHAFAEGMLTLSVAGDINADYANVTTYAYNSLVDILTKQGVAGLITSAFAVGAGLWTQHKVSRPLFYAALSLLIFSMFSYPFELLPYRILSVLCVVTAVTEKERIGESHGTKPCTLIFQVALILTFVIPTYTMVCKAYEADMEYASFRGMTEEIFTEDYRRLLPQEEDNAEFLFDYAQTLRRAKRYNDSNDMLRRGTLVSADPMFYVLMGNNYKDMSLYNMAESAYKKAFSVMPNRIYPLYQLMLLYELQSKTKTATTSKQPYNKTANAKMKTVAKRIVKMKPKIKSPATEEMKKKAQDLIHNS